MQKLINAIALLSGLVSLSVVGGGAYLYLQKDVLIDDARKNAIETVTKSVTEALPGLIKDQMPELPTTTGGAIPF
jgi:hypothetical protein